MIEGPNKQEVFGRISDLEILPLEYYKLVSDFNLLIQQELSETLQQNEATLGAVTLITPGSDARLEKGSFMSPLEVIALLDHDLDFEVYEKTLIEVIDQISSTVIAKIIETKGSNSSLVRSYGGRYQPGRMADSRFLYGSAKLAQNAKLKLGQEILGLSADEVEKIKSLKRDARKVTETGINRIGGTEALHFDINLGTVFYNPEAHQLSFKVGPLRLVQNTLLFEEVKHTRSERNPDFISTLDSSIVNRLHQLSDDHMVNLARISVEEIMEHYAFFMRLYHRSERAYGQDKQTTLQLTPSQAQEISNRLQALSALMERFQIKKQPK